MNEEQLLAIIKEIDSGRDILTKERAQQGLARLCDLQKDSVEINLDGKSGELKAIHVKAYDLTTEGAARSAVLGLIAAKAAYRKARDEKLLEG